MDVSYCWLDLTWAGRQPESLLRIPRTDDAVCLVLTVHNDRLRLIDMGGGDACHRLYTMPEVGAADALLRVMVDGLRLIGGDLCQAISIVSLPAGRQASCPSFP